MSKIVQGSNQRRPPRYAEPTGTARGSAGCFSALSKCSVVL